MKRELGKLVMSVAQKYRYSRLTQDELVEAGFKGLKKAARMYAKKKKADYKFESYAVWWIRQSMLEAIKAKG